MCQHINNVSSVNMHFYILRISLYLFVTKIMHAGCNISSKLQELLGGERGGSSMLLCKSRIGLKDAALS